MDVHVCTYMYRVGTEWKDQKDEHLLEQIGACLYLCPPPPPLSIFGPKMIFFRNEPILDQLIW